MKKILFAMWFVASFGYSQEKIPFIDYNQIVEEIQKEKSNENIVKLIDKISKNDSAYYSLLTSKSYYLLQLKKYEEALKVVNEGINNPHEFSKVIFYTNKGVALSNLKKYDEALENYNKGIQLYPKHYLLWYNKGFVLESQGKLNEAVNAYKKAITFNPLYTKPHLQIGNIYYKQERLTQALMCFNMYLLLEPDAAGAFTILKSLNNIIKAKNSNKRNRNIRLDDQDDSFEEIDLILTSKVALNENYQINNPIKVAITKQNHAMIQQLKEFKGNGGFWDKTYVPFYQWIAENNKFDDFIYTLTYSIENEKYKKIIQKNTPKIIAFLGDLKTQWKKYVSKNTILFNGKQEEVTYEYNDSYVDAIGKIKSGKPFGFWEFYNESGQNFATGNFDTNGQRSGKWVWFNSFNKIKETAFYKDGKLEGENKMFYSNGKMYVDAIYKNDSLEGKYEYFNNKGALMQRKYFKSGNLDGLYKSYFNVGEKIIEFDIPYTNGEANGEVKEYFANGELYAKSNFVLGKKTGLETVYQFNKKVASEIDYENGEINGSFKSFHPNGKIKEIGQSLEGAYDGAWKMYYANGTLESEFSYKKGNLHDLYKYYDRDGKLFYEYLYRKGEIIAYKFYNKDGSILKEGKKKGGEFYYEGFSPKGNKTTEGLYDISGGKIGEWKFYNNNVVLTDKGNFIENNIDGDYHTYYKNGNLEYITPYKNGVIDGYYVSYHVNKQMGSQGWYKEGNQHGEWRYYYLNGTLKATNFFHKGKLHGVQQNFGVDGKLITSYIYSYDDLISETIFDKEEKAFQKVNYTPSENEYTLEYKHFNNNKIKAKIDYVNQVRHGKHEVFYFSGKKKITGNYINGKENGTWTWYYENGKIESEANYLLGNLNGKVTNYYKNGKIEGEFVYENGVQVDKSTRYYESGLKDTEIEFYEGKQHGKQNFYDKTGKLQLIRFYNHGELIGYSYLDKNGTEIDMIPLSRESGKINAYFDNGKPSKTMEFKFGDFVNNYKSYSYSGTIEEEINHLDGEYHGVKKEYFANGKLKEEINYNHGEKHGKSIIYYENGNKKEEILFSNDIKHGMSYFYNEDGKLIMKKEYYNDKVYKIENL